nr:hypothetical protein [uncultured Rhodopila sp.]
MTTPVGRITGLLAPLLLLGACSWDHGLHRSTELLNDRLQARLAPDIAAGSAALQPAQNGAVVTLLGNSDFTEKVDAQTGTYREVRASVIQGLLDPSLIHIAVADTSSLTAEQRATRVRNVTQYFKDNGLALSLLPEGQAPVVPAGTPAAAAPQGVTITLLLDCPAHRQPNNWNYLPPIPSCH